MMKMLLVSKVKLIIAATVAIIFIAFPTAIVWINPDSYNPLTQVLFDFMLLGVSIWIGAAISSEEAKKQATEKWIPAAESACKELLTMETIIKRRQRKQAEACQALEPFITDIPRKNLGPLNSIVKMRCGECSENLSILRLKIRNSLSIWDVFIETNCEEETCEAIHKRLDETRQELDAALEAI